MTTTPPDSRNALAEIVAGLDGVTPGPWFDWDALEWLVEPQRLLSSEAAAHIARCSPEVFPAIASLVSSQDARIAALEAQVEGMRVAAEACGGQEQPAFEAWASANGYDMHEHPLHYLFMDAKTYAARQGWNAALRYIRETDAALQSSETTGEK